MTEKVKQRKEYLLSIVFITLSVIFWGYSFISTKIVLVEAPPVSIAFFRQIIAVTVLAIWHFRTPGASKISWNDLWLIAGSGLFGIVLYFVFENTGLQYTTASNAAMIVAAVPIFTLVSEILFYKLKAGWTSFFYLILSVIGVYLVISVNGKLDFSSARFRGNILMIAAMASWVVYTIMNKSLSRKYSSVSLILFQSVASIFLFIPFVIPEIHQWKMLTPVSFVNLIYLGVFCSALSYYFYIYAVKRLGPTVSAAFLNLIPVVAVLCGYFLLGERLVIIQIVGMVLIMFSIFKLDHRG
jgi:drug/metabolite transporter (DMT)-like permease